MTLVGKLWKAFIFNIFIQSMLTDVAPVIVEEYLGYGVILLLRMKCSRMIYSRKGNVSCQCRCNSLFQCLRIIFPVENKLKCNLILLFSRSVEWRMFFCSKGFFFFWVQKILQFKSTDESKINALMSGIWIAVSRGTTILIR